MAFRADALAARIRPLFEENFSRFGELGAAVSIWQDGRPVLELHGGFRDAQRETALDRARRSFSSGRRPKASAAPVCSMSCRSSRIALERRVAEFWPEFAQAGKEGITLAQLLSHQAGLVALDEAVEVTDYAAVVRALEKQKPLWPPGTAHGYHARTFGFLLDELVRRIDSPLASADYWREVFAEPLGLDIWIGLPAEENARVATIYAAKATTAAPPDEFLSGARALRARSSAKPSPRRAVCTRSAR